MKRNDKKALVLSRETVRNLNVRASVKTGGANSNYNCPTASQWCPQSVGCNHKTGSCTI